MAESDGGPRETLLGPPTALEATRGSRASWGTAEAPPAVELSRLCNGNMHTYLPYLTSSWKGA